MCKRNQLTSNLYYVRDATDPSGSRGARGDARAAGRGGGREREGEGRTLRGGASGGGPERAAASGRLGRRRPPPRILVSPAAA